MKKTGAMIFLLWFLTSSIYSQCTLRPIFIQEYANWPETQVPYYVELINPIRDWALFHDASSQTILNLPSENSLGDLLIGETLLFSIRYFGNACTETVLSENPSAGVLTHESTQEIDPYTFDAFYSYTHNTEEVVNLDFTLSDTTAGVIFSSRMTVNVYGPQEFDLTVSLGTGTTGTPSISGSYESGTSVPYNYSTETCYTNLDVRLDTTPIPSSGNILMDDHHDLVVTADLMSFDVTVTSGPNGDTDHDGTNPVDCNGSLTVLARPDTGFEFSGWSGDVTGTQNPLQLTDIQQDYTIHANFAPLSTINLFVSRVEVIQGTTMSAPYRVYIAERDAVVRVFVGMTGTSSQSNVNARLTRYVGATEMDQIVSDNGPLTLPSTPSESSMSHTLNFVLPAAWLQVGTSYVLELDHDNLVLEFNENDNRFPASGEQDFEFQAVDSLDIVVVPIHYTHGSSSTPTTSNLSYLDWMPIKVYPVHEINYTLHSTVNYTGDLTDFQGWSDMLSQIAAIHDSEDPGQKDFIYYGLVDFYSVDGCPGTCIAGLGYTTRPTSVGFSGWGPGTPEASETFTHEMGHNFARQHAPCGVSPSDPGFPYSSGGIGQFGLDVSTLELKKPGAPDFYKDYMGYCSPNWTSDYTYKAIYDFRETHSWKTMLHIPWEPCIYFGGAISPEGNVTLTPFFQQQAPPLQIDSEGSLELELYNQDGEFLLERSFEAYHIGCGDGTVGFGVFLPAVKDAAFFRLYQEGNLIWENPNEVRIPTFAVNRLVQFKNGNKEISWTAEKGSHTRIRFSPDGGQSWKVLGFDHQEDFIVIPENLIQTAAEPLIELQFNMNLQSREVIIEL